MAVSYAVNDLGLSERRACLLAGVSPSVYRYEPKQNNDEALRQRLRELAWPEETLWQSQAAHYAQAGKPGGESQTHRTHLQRGRSGTQEKGDDVRVRLVPESSYRPLKGQIRSGAWTLSPTTLLPVGDSGL
jgi:hypothetical protein